MASCEPWRQTAYDEDLRWRMVWQREALGYTYSAIARNLNVDEATALRTLGLFQNTGRVSKKSYCTSDTNRVLTSAAQLYVLNLVVSKPGIYLREIQKEFLMVSVSVANFCIRMDLHTRDSALLHCNKTSF